MIVERATWKVKAGCTDQAIALLKSEFAQWEGYKWRLYTPKIGKFDMVAYEFEYENLAEYEKMWQDWYAKPETAEFDKKWYELVEPGGETEIWNLA